MFLLVVTLAYCCYLAIGFSLPLLLFLRKSLETAPGALGMSLVCREQAGVWSIRPSVTSLVPRLPVTMLNCINGREKKE